MNRIRIFSYRDNKGELLELQKNNSTYCKYQELFLEKYSKIVNENSQSNKKEVVHGQKYMAKHFEDNSPFLSLLDFFQENSIYRHSDQAIEKCVDGMQYIMFVPVQAGELSLVNKNFSIYAYEEYSKNCYINDKESFSVSNIHKDDKISCYADLYERIETLLPKTTVIIPNISKNNLHFMQSPNNSLFALCSHLSPYTFLTYKHLKEQKGCYYEVNYNDAELIRMYPDVATHVGFINGVRDIIYGQTYYELVYDKKVHAQEPLYHSLVYGKLTDNFEYYDTDKFIDITYELNSIGEYYKEQKCNFNYSDCAKFLLELYK